MRILIYSFQTAIKSLWHEKWINFLTILSVGVGLMILGGFVTITLNLDSVLKRWSRDFGIVVYLSDRSGREEEEILEGIFRNDTDILDVKYISKDQAAAELRQILGVNSAILDDLDENPLPSSFELKLKRELIVPALVKNKAEKIRQIKGVEDVQYGEKWLSSLNTVSLIMKISAFFLGCAVLIAITFITYNTIKIFFYRRKDEIETLKLLGATRTFIRMPFLIEGLFIGIFGGLIGAFTLFGIQSFISIKGFEFLPSLKAIFISLPVQSYIYFPVTGAIMSITGSIIAVGKIRY